MKIVHPEGHFVLKPEHTGEIWVAGSGKCQGYSNSPELTLKQFRARLVDDTPYDDGYLRTGDTLQFGGGLVLEFLARISHEQIDGTSARAMKPANGFDLRQDHLLLDILEGAELADSLGRCSGRMPQIAV